MTVVTNPYSSSSRSELGTNAARIVTTKFSGTKMATRYLSIYDSLIAEKEVVRVRDDLLVGKANPWAVEEL